MDEEDQDQEDQEEEKEDEEDKDKDEPDQIPEEFVFEAEVRGEGGGQVSSQSHTASSLSKLSAASFPSRTHTCGAAIGNLP